MSQFKTPTLTLEHPASRVFAFLSNLHSFEALLPADRVSEFNATSTSCSFVLDEMISITLTKTAEVAPAFIQLKSESSLFALTLEGHLVGITPQRCEGYLDFQLEAPLGMSLLLKPAIEQFALQLSENIQTYPFETSSK